MVWFKEENTKDSENIAVYILLFFHTMTLTSIIYSYQCRSIYTVLLSCFLIKAKSGSLLIAKKSLIVYGLKNLVVPVKMVFLSRGNTC